MSLHERLEADLRASMKARDRARTSALRLAVAALKNRAVADGVGPQGRLDDEVVQQVLAAELKRRREAASAYRDAGRDESAAAEEAEAALYAAYLPEPLDEDRLRALVDEVVAEQDAAGPSSMGPVIKAVLARAEGRADGSRVSALVRERLTG